MWGICALKVSAWKYVEHMSVCIAFLPFKREREEKSEKEEIVKREEELIKINFYLEISEFLEKEGWNEFP